MGLHVGGAERPVDLARPALTDAFMTATPGRLVIRPARPEDRKHLVEFMAALQEHERTLHPNRSNGLEVAASHLSYLEKVAGTCGAVLVALRGDTVRVSRVLSR